MPSAPNEADAPSVEPQLPHPDRISVIRGEVLDRHAEVEGLASILAQVSAVPAGRRLRLGDGCVARNPNDVLPGLVAIQLELDVRVFPYVPHLYPWLRIDKDGGPVP